MGIFFTSDILRSIGSAVILVLNNIDPDEGFQSLSDDSLHAGGRLAFTYQGQTFPIVYGAYGTIAYPGISVEAGEANEYLIGRFTTPIILSFTREILDTPELDLKYLDLMCSNVDTWLRDNRFCPVYDFGALDTHIEITGRVNWVYSNIRERYVNMSVVGGWIRKEYMFEIKYTQRQPTITE